MKNLINFDRDKAIAAILYIAKGLGRSDTRSILKTLYFADKYHLNRYSRFIIGDKYSRMEQGMVASDTYTLLKGSNKHFKAHGVSITPLEEPEMDEFSRSDLVALDYAIDFCKSKTAKELSELSHDDIYNANKQHFVSIDDFIDKMENRDVLKHDLSL